MTARRINPGVFHPQALHQGNALLAAIIGMASVAISLILVAKVIHWTQDRVMDTASRHMQESLARTARQAKASAEALKEDQRDRAAAQAAAQRAAIDTQQASIAAAQRATDQREAAWQRFYRPSPQCENSNSRPVVECANEFIRAKRAFEERYRNAAQ